MVLNKWEWLPEVAKFTIELMLWAAFEFKRRYFVLHRGKNYKPKALCEAKCSIPAFLRSAGISVDKRRMGSWGTHSEVGFLTQRECKRASLRLNGLRRINSNKSRLMSKPGRGRMLTNFGIKIPWLPGLPGNWPPNRRRRCPAQRRSERSVDLEKRRPAPP